MSGNNVSLRKESIGCERFFLGTRDAGGPWNIETPVFVGGALHSSATQILRWKQIGKTVHMQLYVSQTSAGTATGTLFLKMPVPPVADPTHTAVGSIVVSSSSGTYLGIIQVNTNDATFAVMNKATPSVYQELVHTADPRMSETTFAISASLTYEAA